MKTQQNSLIQLDIKAFTCDGYWTDCSSFKANTSLTSQEATDSTTHYRRDSLSNNLKKGLTRGVLIEALNGSDE